MSDDDRGLLPGTVDLVILKTLTAGPAHGFGLSRTIRGRSDGVLDIQDGALYKALHRMEESGWVEAEWGVSRQNRRAKFYRITGEGLRQLKKEVGFWERYARAIDGILDRVPGGERA